MISLPAGSAGPDEEGAALAAQLRAHLTPTSRPAARVAQPYETEKHGQKLAEAIRIWEEKGRPSIIWRHVPLDLNKNTLKMMLYGSRRWLRCCNDPDLRRLGFAVKFIDTREGFIMAPDVEHPEDKLLQFEIGEAMADPFETVKTDFVEWLGSPDVTAGCIFRRPEKKGELVKFTRQQLDWFRDQLAQMPPGQYQEELNEDCVLIVKL